MTRSWVLVAGAVCAWALCLAGCGGTVDVAERVRPGTVVGGPGDDPGRFVKPRAIDGDGEHVFVIDRSGRVQVLDPETGRCLAYWRLPEWSLGYPTGVTVGLSPVGDGSKAVWVADTHYHRVLVYAMPVLGAGAAVAQSPALLLEFGGYGNGGGQFIYPSDVLVVGDGNGKRVARVYVSEFGGNDRVSMFEVKSGGAAVGSGSVRAEFVGQFGRLGEAGDAGAFQRPQSLAWRAGDGKPGGRGDEVLVTDSINHRVGRFTPDGKLVAWLNGAGVPGKGPGQFSHPRGLQLLEDGTLLVVEFGNNRVQRLDLETGGCLGLYGVAGRGEGELAEPWAVGAVGRDGLIADAMNHRLVRFRLPSAALGGYGAQMSGGVGIFDDHVGSADASGGEGGTYR